MDTPSELKIPDLVNRALNLAEQMEYSGECSHEVGSLLQVFVGHIQSGVVGELCAGCGVGTSWIASALKPTTSFVTIEENESHTAAVKRLVEPYLNIRVITGQWRTLLKEWKFSLLFVSTYSERKAAQAYLLKKYKFHNGKALSWQPAGDKSWRVISLNFFYVDGNKWPIMRKRR